MKLMYQTSDRTRADEVIGVLADAGIDTSLHGVHTAELRGSRIPNPLSVWVVKDEEEQKAKDILEAYFATEVSPRRPIALGPPSAAKKLMPFIIALAVGAALAVVANGI